MVKQMTATDLEAKLLAVLDGVAAGDHRHPRAVAVW
jgi:hypothetical protein